MILCSVCNSSPSVPSVAPERTTECVGPHSQWKYSLAAFPAGIRDGHRHQFKHGDEEETQRIHAVSHNAKEKGT